MAERLLGAFCFSEFRVVRQLNFYDWDGCDSVTPSVQLVMETEDRKPNYRITLIFTGVTDLKINEFGGGPTRVTGFDILDISDRGLEGANWEIEDFENGVLGFRASTAEVTAAVNI